MELKTVKIEKPADLNFILGQSHFIKTVEDLYEDIVQTVPGMKFGLGFCESSGPALVRHAGNDARLIELARKRSEEHTSELQSHSDLVCRLLLEKKNAFRRASVDSSTKRKNYCRSESR